MKNKFSSNHSTQSLVSSFIIASIIVAIAYLVGFEDIFLQSTWVYISIFIVLLSIALSVVRIILIREEFLSNIKISLTKRQIFGMAGSILLFLGIFLPSFSFRMPIRITFIALDNIGGSISYFGYSSILGSNEWIILIIFSFVSFILSVFEKYLGVLLIGILSLVIIMFTVIDFSQKRMLLLSAFPEITNIFPPSSDLLQGVLLVFFEWGALLLVSGPILMIFSGTIPKPK